MTITNSKMSCEKLEKLENEIEFEKMIKSYNPYSEIRKEGNYWVGLIKMIETGNKSIYKEIENLSFSYRIEETTESRLKVFDTTIKKMVEVLFQLVEEKYTNLDMVYKDGNTYVIFDTDYVFQNTINENGIEKIKMDIFQGLMVIESQYKGLEFDYEMYNDVIEYLTQNEKGLNVNVMG